MVTPIRERKRLWVSRDTLGISIFNNNVTIVLFHRSILAFNYVMDKGNGGDFLKGVLFAIIGGALITLQGTFNAKLSSDIGIWSTSVMTHLIGFLIAISVFFIRKEGALVDLKSVKKVYLTSGAFGAIIIFAETSSIYAMGITLTAGTLMVAQLLTATLIEINGLFDVKKIQMKNHHIVGTIIMILGILVFNM